MGSSLLAPSSFCWSHFLVVIILIVQTSSISSSKALSTLSVSTAVALFFGPLIFYLYIAFPSTHLDKFLAIFMQFSSFPESSHLYIQNQNGSNDRVCRQLVSHRRYNFIDACIVRPLLINDDVQVLMIKLGKLFFISLVSLCTLIAESTCLSLGGT